jgi:hypothetical protein
MLRERYIYFIAMVKLRPSEESAFHKSVNIPELAEKGAKPL